MAELTFYGHATVGVTTDDGTRIVIDPFFGDNPATEVSVNQVEADFVFITHGHYDHLADAQALVERTGALLVSTVEVVEYFQSQGVEKAHGMNIGGAHDFGFGRVKMVPANHGGRLQLPGGEGYTTPCSGYVMQVDGCRLYHAGDTALVMDMQLLEGQVDVALLPIGDNFTMGPEDAARAVRFIKPKVAIPIHYDTWPVIEQDPGRFVAAVGDVASVRVLAPGESTSLS